MGPPTAGERFGRWLASMGWDREQARKVGDAASFTPMAQAYDAGQLIRAGLDEASPTNVGVGVGLAALAALPFGVRARVPARLPAREVTLTRAAVPREPPPITGHNIGSLQMPRVPRNVDPETGLYSAAEEAAHAYPRTGGTSRDIQDWMASQGVTANELRYRNLNSLFQDPRRTITRQELLQHLSDNPINLRSARYQGDQPFVNLRRNTTEADAANRVHEIEDLQSGRTFTLTEDLDAGNVYVQGDRGRFLEVPGRANRQTYDDGLAAIRAHLEGEGVPAGAAGPVGYRDYALNAERNPTYAETVLHAPPGLTPSQLRAREAAGAPYRAEMAALNDRATRYGPDRAEAQARLMALQNRMWEDALRVAPDPPRGFVDSHYPDQPNPIGWTRGSRQQAFERGANGDADLSRSPLDVYNLDEVQLPQAQAIRDRGARNEARVAELEGRTLQGSKLVDRASAEADEFIRRHSSLLTPGTSITSREGMLNALHTDTSGSTSQQAFVLGNRLRNAQTSLDLATRELETARQGVSGNAFVEDPQQALRTTLHHFLASNPALRDPNLSGLTLTPGVMQNARYNLSRVVPQIEVETTFPPSGMAPMRQVRLYGQDHGVLGALNVRPDGRVVSVNGARQLAAAKDQPLESVVGRDVAREIMAPDPLNAPRFRTIETGALEVGGRGMRENYDRIYPETIDAIFGRLDPAYPGRRQVHINMRAYNDPAVGISPSWHPDPVHFFPLTDRIRAQLARGLPYFVGAGAALPMLGRERDGQDPLERYSTPPQD